MKTKPGFRVETLKQKAAVGAGLMAAISAAHGQALETHVNTNANVFTETQRNTGIAVSRACVNLSAMSGLVGDQADLLNECRRMVRTANYINGSPTVDPRLGTDPNNATLADGLQMIAPEEIAAQGRVGVDVNTQNVTDALKTRLAALRAGARGLSFNGLQLDEGGKLALKAPPRGGAAGEGDPRWGVFINATFNRADKDTTSREDGFDAKNWSLNGGVDYRVSDNFVVGGALSYSDTAVDIDGGLGAIDTTGLGLSAYASAGVGNFYVEGFLSYVFNEYESSRNIGYLNFSTTLGPPISRVANGDTKGNQITFGVGGGYDIALQSVTVTPYGRLEYLELTIDDFDESGASGLNLHIDKQSVTSLQTALGVRAGYSVSTSSGVIRPQLSLEWNHEFDNNSRSVVARYIHDPQGNLILVPTEDPDRNYFTLGLGISAVLQSGMSAFVNYSTVLGYGDLSHHSLTAGARWEF